MHKISSRSSKLVSWSLHKHSEGVYVVQVPRSFSRAMLFLRYQEFYESPRAEFRNQHFDIFHFMNQYCLDRGTDVFSYPVEWLGFNIPGEVLLSCVAGVRQRNLYDKEMLAICKLIQKDVVGKFYLLGVDHLDGSLMNHELAHAFYYLDPKYRREANKLISNLSKTKVAKMKKLLLSWGYRKEVLLDEIQADLATGLGSGQKKIFSPRDCRKFIQHFTARRDGV